MLRLSSSSTSSSSCYKNVVLGGRRRSASASSSSFSSSSPLATRLEERIHKAAGVLESSSSSCRCLSSSFSSSSSSNSNSVCNYSSSSIIQQQQYDNHNQNQTNNVLPSETYDSGAKFWSYNELTGRAQRPIFVAATKQHVGKTTCSLAIMAGLQKRFDQVGFLKPVGQQHVPVQTSLIDPTTGSQSIQEIRVDKDVVLMREHFHLEHVDYGDMSPVIIPQGYTKRYVDGEIAYEEQLSKVKTAMHNVSSNSDIVLIEGTGHCAVGSIVGLNNAKVASILGADMVLIANGGLGKAFDELELNRILCQHYNVRIAGVIINKVIPSKYEQTKHYIAKAMKQVWGVPLLGCIPDRPFLGCPALADLERVLESNLVSGTAHRFRHYSIKDITVVTTSLTRFLENLREKPTRTLYICHVTRDDLIVGFLGEYQRRKRSIIEMNNDEPKLEAALLVCGRKGKYQLSSEVKDMIEASEDAPIMVIGKTTHDTMNIIHQFTPKLNIEDTNRVNVAVDHYEPYMDFDELLRRTTSSNSSFNEPGDPSLDDIRRL